MSLMVKDLIGDLESIDKGSVVERLDKWTKKKVDTIITNDLISEPMLTFFQQQQQQAIYASQFHNLRV